MKYQGIQRDIDVVFSEMAVLEWILFWNDATEDLPGVRGTGADLFEREIDNLK